METENDVFKTVMDVRSIELAAESVGRAAQIITTTTSVVLARLGFLSASCPSASCPNDFSEISRDISQMELGLIMLNNSVRCLREEFNIAEQKIVNGDNRAI